MLKLSHQLPLSRDAANGTNVVRGSPELLIVGVNQCETFVDTLKNPQWRI
jgi:hypothetical protein